MSEEISTKPYLLRAIHEWCTDSGYTPYIAVSVDEHTLVPTEFVRAGEIVLNISMSATNRLSIGNDLIEFQARFGGTARELSIPVDNVSAIYARENGHGMAFEVAKAPAVVEDDDDDLAEDEDVITLVGEDPSEELDEGAESEPDSTVEPEPQTIESADAEPIPDSDDAPDEAPAKRARKSAKSRSGKKKSNTKLAAVPKSDSEDNPDSPDDSSDPAPKGKSRKRSGKPKLTRVK